MLSPDITDLRCPVRFIFTEEAELFESELCEPGNCVIWFYPGYGALEQMNRLKAKNVRQFLVNRSFDGYSFVTIDYFASLKEGLKILLEKCGRETAVIGYDQNYENRPWQPERIIGYFQAASTLGMSTGEGRIFLKSYTDTVNEMNNLVQQLFLPGTRKLGITILNQELVLPFLMATSQVNRKPGRDFYLLLCDYREELEPYLGILMLNQRGYSILGEYMLKLVIEHILQGQLDFRQRIKLELVGSDRL